MRKIKFRAWDGKKMLDIWRAEIKDGYLVTLNEQLDAGYYQIMQFTGLLDKNGKEIYEGDILSHGESSLNKKVDWVAERACFMFGIYTLDTGISIAEIIGNIYENPELLK